MRLLGIILLLLIISCSYMPPKSEIERENNKIGLYEEWLMGLIALRNTKTPFYNNSNELNKVEKKFQWMIRKLHYGASDLKFWRKTYYPPEVIIYRTRAKNAYALPGGFVCMTTGLLAHVYRKSKRANLVMAGILSHELVHLYLEHPKKHYVAMLLKDNVSRQYQEMASGIQSSAGDFQSSYSKMLIRTILKAKKAGIEGYEAEMEFDADVKAVLIMIKAGIHPKGLLEALKLMRHHTGGIHGSYLQRTQRVKLAIQKYLQ